MTTPTPEEKSKRPVIKLELTPPKPVINPDSPLSMTVKNTTKEIQAVVVEVDSYLFTLKNPRAEIWPYFQIYHKLEPGGTLSFKIRFVKKPPKQGKTANYYDKELLKKPEGWLRVYHRKSLVMNDTDEDWGFINEDDDPYFPLPGRRRVSWKRSGYDGYVEMDLICEKETEKIKKIKEGLGKEEKPKKGCSIM